MKLHEASFDKFNNSDVYFAESSGQHSVSILTQITAART